MGKQKSFVNKMRHDPVAKKKKVGGGGKHGQKRADLGAQIVGPIDADGDAIVGKERRKAVRAMDALDAETKRKPDRRFGGRFGSARRWNNSSSNNNNNSNDNNDNNKKKERAVVPGDEEDDAAWSRAHAQAGRRLGGSSASSMVVDGAHGGDDGNGDAGAAGDSGIEVLNYGAARATDGKMTKRILEEARKQQDEMRRERGEDIADYDKDSDDDGDDGNNNNNNNNNSGNNDERRGIDLEAFEEEEEEEDIRAAEMRGAAGVGPGDKDVDKYMTEADERDLAMFMPESAPVRRNLADFIMDKFREINSADPSLTEGLDERIMKELDPKVIHVYTQIGKLLRRYTFGKLPKAFKVLPSLRNWEEVMYLTRPEEWSAPAVREATRLFASNLNARMAQRFYSLVLLPRVQEDFHTHKRINFHLYYSLQKALYKPAAFFKGILLPLCEPGACTLAEAAIIASVLTKVSVPVLHSSAAILKMCEMDYSGPVSVFMRALLDKRYALPYRVVDAVVDHFARFISDSREMPVLWHQCLLVFVQRYKEDITEEQREMIRDVLRVKKHHMITDEIRRELFRQAPVGIDAKHVDSSMNMD